MPSSTSGCLCPCLAAAVVCLASVAHAGGAGVRLAKKDWEALSNHDVSKFGRGALDIRAEKWKHGETEHFILHYFKDANRLARRLEASYATISEFFGDPPDRKKGWKSHIYAFDDFDDWDTFRVKVMNLPWIGGVCVGDEFFLVTRDREDKFDSQATVIHHEMTHLMFNRFYSWKLPLWLNEGIAEYFGQRERLGLSKFRKKMSRPPTYSLAALLSMRHVPEDVRGFYIESAIVVDFLTARHDEKLLRKLVEYFEKGHASEKALQTVYGYESTAAFAKKYARYRKKFR